ncbi:GDSL esterase/lipase At2g03980-like [Rhododendron vialii]|uniref:GDSL esterase/lipase At2g03980-like n=1 Tax=Rhododendron vialii TaxID=182163 RepID=UPI00265E1DC8|nr:GDSL esterase/lipase At2g03980-like [Rhododendron vialii]
MVILSASAASHGQDDRNPEQMALGIYVFGNSTVDSGNGWGASLLGLPDALPFQSLTDVLNASTITGINYAVARTGILSEIGINYRNNTSYWDFDLQIELFNVTMTIYLCKFLNQQQMGDHLSKLIFFVSFGINDFNLNFLPPSKGTLCQLAPQVFSELLLEALAQRLKMLHKLAAGKMLINNIWPLGCSPMFSNSFACYNGAVNQKVLPYSMGLPQLLNGLKSNLTGALFSFSDNFAFVANLKQGPTFGKFKYSCMKLHKIYFFNLICCGAEVDHYLYVDSLHLNVAASRVFSFACFNGTMCSPNVL